jgi:nucleotide-binding universal stress UspA family protein
MTFRTIVAATDLSACSGDAIAYADAIARSAGAALTFIHVMSGVPAYAKQHRDKFEGVDVTGDRKKSIEAARTKVERFVEKRLPHATQPNVLVTAGSPVPQILATAATVNADLLVLGTRGRSLLARAFLGSVAEGVIHDSDIPVMTVRCGRRVPEPAFRLVVCAVNYMAVSGAAFAHAVTLASAFGARLVAVSVLESDDSTIEEETERLQAWTRNDVVAVEPKVLVARKKASTALLEYLKKSDADLVVVGARRRTFQKKTTLGSTTNAITRRARCPVLTVSRAND